MVLDQADAASQQYQSGVPVQRSPSLGTFILDSLDMAGRELKTRHLRAFDDLKNHFDARVDHNLIQPFTEAETRANKMKEQNCHKFSDELEAVVAHVEEVRLQSNRVSLVNVESLGNPKIDIQEARSIERVAGSRGVAEESAVHRSWANILAP